MSRPFRPWAKYGQPSMRSPGSTWWSCATSPRRPIRCSTPLAGSGAQLARGVASNGQLSVSFPGSTTGTVTIVVRSRTPDAVQTGDVWLDGRRIQAALPFSSGAVIALTGIASGEEARGIEPPNGSPSHLAYLTSADGLDILSRAAGRTTRLPLPQGRNVQLVYGTRLPAADAPITVYRNDAGHDSDGDGLGDALEFALGTCGSTSGSVAGVECRDIPDPRDTDGDGLWDGWEVLGRDTVYTNPAGARVHEDVALPAWGADPRHKDIFAEVDFRRLTQADSINGVAEHMSPMVARQMAGIYADTATTDPLLQVVHSLSVNNPDRRPGVSLHLDTGVPPLTPADATIYGDWGGYTAVDAVPDAQGNYQPQTPGGAWPREMSPGRWGMFHYVLGYTTGGGSCGYGIACGFNMANAGNSAHEFGHTLGLDHNGPNGLHEPNCKPNYPSLMNYAYLNSGLWQFSDGSKFPTLNNHALTETGAIDAAYGGLLRTLVQQYYYKVDSATGSVDWNRDNQFAPAGATVRAYANLQPGNGGGCEFTREGETQVGMLSQAGPALVRFRDHLWVFSVTLAGKLAFSYTPTPYTCNAVDDCPNLSFVTPGVRDLGAMTAVDAATIRVNNRPLILIVGIRPNGSLFETWVEEQGGLFVWGAVDSIPAAPAAGEPSLAVSADGKTVVLAYRGQDNVVRYRYRSPATFQAEQTMTVGGQPLVMSPTASPALAFTWLPIGLAAGREHLVAAVIDTNRYVQLYAPGQLPAHGWARLGIPYGPMWGATGRPALAWVGAAPGNTLSSTGDLAVAPGAGRPAAAPPDSAHRAADRPRPVSPAVLASPLSTAVPSTYGRLYILYIRYADPVEGASNPDPVRMEMSYVDAAGTLRIGLDSWFDNIWSFAFGVDLLQPGEVALRAAQSYAIPNAGDHPNSLYQVTVRPHADGIADLPYRNYDDWKVIGWGSCTTLAGQQPAGVKVACADKSW